jgi:hypothetical protein
MHFSEQIIADTFNKHFVAIPEMITHNIAANYCLSKTFVNNQHKFSFSLKRLFQNSIPSIKCNCTAT